MNFINNFYHETKKFVCCVGIRITSGAILNSTTGFLGRTVFSAIGFLIDKPVGIIVDKCIRIPSSSLLQLKTKVVTHICIKTLATKYLYEYLYEDDELTITDAIKINAISITVFLGIMNMLNYYRDLIQIFPSNSKEFIKKDENFLIRLPNVVEDCIIEEIYYEKHWSEKV